MPGPTMAKEQWRERWVKLVQKSSVSPRFIITWRLNAVFVYYFLFKVVQFYYGLNYQWIYCLVIYDWRTIKHQILYLYYLLLTFNLLQSLNFFALNGLFDFISLKEILWSYGGRRTSLRRFCKVGSCKSRSCFLRCLLLFL